MSHYARLIAPLDCRTSLTNESVSLGVDIPIRNVRLGDGGSYLFEARCLFGREIVGWLACITGEDLPAFTDRGRAQREAREHVTLAPGRPVGGAGDVKPVAVRVSSAQREWIEKRAARKQVTVSEYVRTVLEAEGMPV